MDLGQILTDLGSTYIQSRWGQPSFTQPTGFFETPEFVSNLGVPGVDVIPEPPNCETSKNMVYDPAKGRWIKRRRRRRRRLITPTDLNDLAALKTVVGGGQALTAATIRAVGR